VRRAKSSRPPRAVGRTKVLTREEVLDTALALADGGELERLTMRRLAEELGVSAMSLYAHVDDKDDILDAVIDQRLRERGLPAPSGDWLAWMTDVAGRLRALLVDNPALLDRYCRRPVGVPAALDRMEASLEVLRQAGFAASDALTAFAAMHTYTIGFASLELARADSKATSSRAAIAPLRETSPGYWPAFLATLDSERFPILASTCPDLASFTGSEQFRAGLETLMAGLSARYIESGDATDPKQS
jgi:AcrR family transcriptional regulator